MGLTRRWRTCPVFLMCGVVLGVRTASPQAAVPAGRPIGVVVAIDAPARQITLKPDAGQEMTIQLQDSTRVLRVTPGSQDLNAATSITLADVSAGDRILVRGRNAGAGNSFVADMIVVMSKADLAKKQESERADWERRGIGGVITSLDQSSREATIRTGDPRSPKTVILQIPSDARLRRYSPGSIRFSDARDSRWEELKVGDQVKARGAGGNGSARFRVEELVSGSFRDFAATIVSVDAERGTLHVLDTAGNNRVEARVLPASLLRHLSPEVVQLLSARISDTGQEPKDASSGRTIQSMIEALPPLRLADLKPGDLVVISGTGGDDPSTLTAITVLTGVEPLLRPVSRGARAPDIGSWNLDLNMGVGVP